MKMNTFLKQTIFLFIMIGIWGCSESQKTETTQTDLMAEKGKEIFAVKNCGRCHTTGEESVKAEAPDLARAILAKDSSFIQTHLKLVETSKMPPIELTDAEIRALSHFIAGLHAQKYQTVSEEDADARCPVCSAPVSMAQAEAAQLTLTYLNKMNYFDCLDCLDTFKQAPGAYAMDY